MTLFRDQLGKRLEELSVGQQARLSRKVTKQDILQYMSLTGDLNPLYGDANYAGRTKYRQPIVPANMLAGFAMGAVATLLPGPGSLTYAHSYRLVRPPHAGDEVTVTMEITALEAGAGRVTIAYVMRDQNGQELQNGTMEVEPPGQLNPLLQHEYESF